MSSHMIRGVRVIFLDNAPVWRKKDFLMRVEKGLYDDKLEFLKSGRWRYPLWGKRPKPRWFGEFYVITGEKHG